MDELIHSYMIYTLLFRLAIITAGVVSIVLGYKLFNFESNIQKPGKQEISASSGKLKFLAKGVSDGTLFSLFGIFLIGFMVYSNQTEFSVKSILETSDNIEKPGFLPGFEISVKGDLDNEGGEVALCLKEYLFEIKKYSLSDIEKINKYSKYIKKCSVGSFGLLFNAFNEMAVLHIANNELDKAKVLSETTVYWYPEDEHYLDTLANIYFKLKDYDKAYQHARRSVDLAPQITDHRDTLNKIKKSIELGENG